MIMLCCKMLSFLFLLFFAIYFLHCYTACWLLLFYSTREHFYFALKVFVLIILQMIFFGSVQIFIVYFCSEKPLFWCCCFQWFILAVFKFSYFNFVRRVDFFDLFFFSQLCNRNQKIKIKIAMNINWFALFKHSL